VEILKKKENLIHMLTFH